MLFFLFIPAFLIVLAYLALMLFLLLRFAFHLKTQISTIILVTIFSIVIIVVSIFVVYRFCNPVIDFPDEYRQYVSDERLEQIVNRESGFYSSKLPTFAERISIKYADENKVIVKTTYFLFGSTVMFYGPDGLSCEQGLFDPELDLSEYH